MNAKWLLILFLPGIVNAKAWCENANGTGHFADKCDTGAVAKSVPSDSDIKKSKIETAQAEALQARIREGWKNICNSEGYVLIEHNIECVNDHEIAYAEMMQMMNSSPPESQKKKIIGCFGKWAHQVPDVIDAKMWRYCYYH